MVMSWIYIPEFTVFFTEKNVFISRNLAFGRREKAFFFSFFF